MPSCNSGARPNNGESQLRVILQAVVEVATPVMFGVGIIILVFLPLMTLQGMEGKMFAPLAYTIAIALFISLILSLTLTPVLLLLPAEARRRWRARHRLIAVMKQPYLSCWTGRWPTRRRRGRAGGRCLLCDAGAAALAGHLVHSGNEGRLDRAGHQSGAEHLAR